MTTRTVTGTIRKPDGTAWASAQVRFDLMTGYATATDAAVAQRVVIAITDVNGDFSVALEVPASEAWQWKCRLPDNNSFLFNLGAGSSTNLHTLIADANLGDTVSASTLADAIADKADKAVPSATNNVALLGADGNLVDSGLGTDDIGGAGDHGDLTGLGDDDHTQYHNDTRGDARYSQLGHNHDHGGLTGLGDDDHTIYLLADGSRALAGAWNLADQALTNVNISSVSAAIGLALGGTGATSVADARTNLGLVAGGAGDIWVEKAGDTMTGALALNASGAAATPLTITMAASPTVSPIILKNSSAVSLFEVNEGGSLEILNRSNASNATNDFVLRGIDSDGIARMELATNHLAFYYKDGNEFFRITNDTNLSAVMRFDRPSLPGYGGYFRGGQTTFGAQPGLAIYPSVSSRRVGFLGASLAQVGLVLNADGSGNMDATFGPTITAENAQVAILNDTVTDNVLLLRAAASQSGDVLLIEKSDGTGQFSIDSAFILNFDMTMGTGTGDPAVDAPADWVEIKIGGVTRYIPVYA